MEEPSSLARPAAAPLREPLTGEQAALRLLSERFVALQRGVRVLEHVSWDGIVEADFFARGAAALPRIDAEWYQFQPLPFDPDARRGEFRDLERDVRRTLGVGHPGGQLLLRRCRESRQVLDLLVARGTAEFGPLSERLYGAAPAAAGLAGQLRRLACRLGSLATGPAEAASVPAEVAVGQLHERLAGYFGERLVRVRLCDDLAANAAATLDTLKVRRDATFTPREVRLLEVHEGWIHLGTTLNGQAQPICTFLSKCLPSTTTTQEGLAVLVEVLAGAAHADRLDRLALRVEGIAWARAGADFLDVYKAYRDRGLTERDAYQQAMRVFRGTPVTGGTAFAKDACYARGFLALGRTSHDDLALLTVGKTRREDLPLLRALLDMGMLRKPRFVPPVFAPRVEMLPAVGVGGLAAMALRVGMN